MALSYCAVPVTPAKPPPTLKGEYAIRISLLPKAHAFSLSESTADKSEDKEEYEEVENEDDKANELDSAQQNSETEKEEQAPAPPTPSPRSEVVVGPPPTVPDKAQDELRPPERTEQASRERDKDVETATEPSSPVPEEPPPPTTPGLREGVRLLGKLAPHYPKRCRRLGHGGSVRLEVKVDASGHVVSVRVVTSAGCEQLDHSAIAAVRTAQFQPARIGAKPISSTVILPVVFRLK